MDSQSNHKKDDKGLIIIGYWMVDIFTSVLQVNHWKINSTNKVGKPQENLNHSFESKYAHGSSWLSPVAFEIDNIKTSEVYF